MEKLLKLEELLDIVRQRIASGDDSSYCRQIALGGVEKIGRKIGEEAIEVLIAAFLQERDASDKNRAELIGEICDLLFHTLILMAQKEISFEEILVELTKRNNAKK